MGRGQLGEGGPEDKYPSTITPCQPLQFNFAFHLSSLTMLSNFVVTRPCLQENEHLGSQKKCPSGFFPFLWSFLIGRFAQAIQEVCGLCNRILEILPMCTPLYEVYTKSCLLKTGKILHACFTHKSCLLALGKIYTKSFMLSLHGVSLQNFYHCPSNQMHSFSLLIAI